MPARLTATAAWARSSRVRPLLMTWRSAVAAGLRGQGDAAHAALGQEPKSSASAESARSELMPMVPPAARIFRQRSLTAGWSLTAAPTRPILRWPAPARANLGPAVSTARRSRGGR